MKILFIIAGVLLFIYAVRLGELYTQPGRYEAYWRSVNQLPAEKNQLLYIALGDSTAQGIGANKPSNGYVGLIAHQLEKNSRQPVKVLNFSETGAKVADAINKQLPKLENCNITKDSVMTIEIGANDMKTFEAEKFEKEMDELMSRLPKQTIISDIPYFGGGMHRSSQPNVEKANGIMRKLAEKHGFKLADLHERTKNNSGPRALAFDWFHPSTYSYRTNWAPAFLEQIDTGENNEKF